MKKTGDVLQALVWLLFTVPVGFGSTVYYFETIASWSASDVIGLVLWGCAILLLFVLVMLLYRLTMRRPGFFQLGNRASLALEMICCVILLAGGIYLRIGQEFVAFWAEQGQNPLVEAAYVTDEGLTETWPDLLSRAYVYLLNQLFMLVGNLNLAAAGMQLVLFSICCFLLYFLVRRVWGSLCACVCLGGLMLFPEMIRVSMYCSPEILLFPGVALIGWVLHLCFDRFMVKGCEAALDLLPLICFLAGCFYYQSSQGQISSDFFFRDRVLEVSAQTALLTGLFSLIIFIFISREARRAVCIYMLMAVLILAVQMMGMQTDAGCGTALSVVMPLLLGLNLQGLLATGDENPEEPEEEGETQSGEEYEEEFEEAADPGYEESGRAATGPSEIFIPKSMAIPARKRKARIDFDREFPEEELKFDIEIPDEDEFDL